MSSEAILVTGCSSGIGRATALALVRRGRTVWASARRPDTLIALEAAGCRVVALDVTDEDSRVSAVEQIETEHGAVGVLINNAGYDEDAVLEEIELDALQRQFDTNVFGLLRMCQLVLPGMRARRRGRIVNVGSVMGRVALPGHGAYCMTKHALEALSDVLRIEVMQFGIDVVLVGPQGVRTELTRRLVPAEIELAGPYGAMKQQIDAYVLESLEEGSRQALSMEHVARVMVKAATDSRPKTRYPIGAMAHVMPPVRRVIPDRMWDKLVERQMLGGQIMRKRRSE